MKQYFRGGKFSSKLLLLTMVVFVVVLIFAGIFWGSNADIQPALAANSPTFNITGSRKTWVSTKSNSTGNNVSLTSFKYSDAYTTNITSDSSKFTITSPTASNSYTLTITTTNDCYYQALYTDVVSSITVPAWHEYTVKFSFSSTFNRSNSDASNGAGFSFFDFGDDKTTGANAGLNFDSSGTSNSNTTPSKYVKQYGYKTSTATATDSSTSTYTYKNASASDVTFKNNFGVFVYDRATTDKKTKITYTLKITPTVTDKSLTLTPPTADTRSFAYTGSEQTYRPTGYDDTTMKLTDDSEALAQTDVGTYNIKIEPITYPWDDGTFDPISFTFTISKADPNVIIGYASPLPSPLYESYGLPEITNTASNPTPGTLSWDPNQRASASVRDYTWTFVPDDPESYNGTHGTVQLTYRESIPQDLVVSVHDGVDLYDRYDTINYPTLDSYIKSCISVKIRYNDGSISDFTLPDSDYEISTTDAQILVSSGTSENKTINIRVTTVGDSLEGMTSSFTADVNKAEIQSIRVAPVDAGAVLQYPVTIDQIKANYNVYVKWNFSNRELRTDPQLITVTPADELNAGTVDLTFTYSNNGLTESTPSPTVCTIQKGNYDMSGVTFAGDTVTYDEQTHTLTVGGTLPDGVTVTYTVAGQSEISFAEVGTYVFTASFSNPDNTNYNDIADMTATLKISPAEAAPPTAIDKPTLISTSQAYTGSPITFELSGFDSDIMTIEGDLSVTEVGEYSVTIRFKAEANCVWSDDNSADAIALTFTVTAQAEPTPPTPAPNNGSGFLDKIKELIDSGFPLWQIAAMAVSGLLAFIFMIKAIQYGNRRKKIVGKKNSVKVAGMLPIFSSEVVLAGLSNQIWSVMAFAFVGLALIMFIVALVTRKAWKKAETAHQEGAQLSQIMQALQQGSSLPVVQSADNSAIIDEMRRQMEAQRREDEERRRADEERHREEMAALREEQAKRDEAMKMMLARMMGRAPEDDGDMPYYGTVDDTDLLVQKVIAGLLPAVQQMIPETTAYLTAPAYEQSASDIEAIADRVAEKLGANIPQSDDNDEKYDALLDEVKGLKKQLAKESKNDNPVDVD
ncbi:MAG: hypothetical protein NC037_06820, partial [Bacteroides sp.]|nr:hypothetical protein [Bacteroides sp.]